MLQSAIAFKTHRDSRGLEVRCCHPNHSEHDQSSKLMAKVFLRCASILFREVLTSISFVLSILQLIGQKSQHPRIVGFGEIDVVKQVRAVKPLELPRYSSIRKNTHRNPGWYAPCQPRTT